MPLRREGQTVKNKTNGKEAGIEFAKKFKTRKYDVQG